jgi:hypothetical protein
VVDEILREAAENRDVSQVGVERPPAVGLVELRAEWLALLQDVEDVAQHLEHRAIGLGAHRCGAWVIIHASHFAEEFTGAKFRDGVVVGQVHRSIDGNRSAVYFLFAAVFLARGKTARKLAGQPPEKSARAALRFYVRDRACQLHAGRAFENVKRGRAELAFPANDFAASKMAPDSRIRIFLQELRRDVFKDRQLEKILGRNGSAVGLPLDLFQLLKNQRDTPGRHSILCRVRLSRPNFI